MFNKIELKNFQSHKHTVIDLSKGINVLCGESDNGKSAVIRAIRWVYENRPLGVDKLNSHWNKNFKEEMSVTLWLNENTYIKRIRSKDRNGYDIFKDDNIINLDATGTDVPQQVRDLLNMSDVNFQFQLDSPYLLSMSSGEASRYLNQIIHLDSIDSILSVADSHKRQIVSEQKVVEKDIKEYKDKINSLNWIDEANAMQKRIDKYDELLDKNEAEQITIVKQIAAYDENQNSIIDFTEQKKLIEDIENIDIPDYSIIERQIKQYESCEDSIIDFTEQKNLIEDIENIDVPDYSALEKSINDFNVFTTEVTKYDNEREELVKQLPDVCPCCGQSLKGVHLDV